MVLAGLFVFHFLYHNNIASLQHKETFRSCIWRKYPIPSSTDYFSHHSARHFSFQITLIVHLPQWNRTCKSNPWTKLFSITVASISQIEKENVWKFFILANRAPFLFFCNIVAFHKKSIRRASHYSTQLQLSFPASVWQKDIYITLDAWF